MPGPNGGEVNGGAPKKLCGVKTAKPGVNRRGLHIDPGGFQITAKRNGVIAVNFGHVLGDLEMLFAIEVNAADEPAGGEQIGNIQRQARNRRRRDSN